MYQFLRLWYNTDIPDFGMSLSCHISSQPQRPTSSNHENIAPAGGLGIVVKASPESGLSYVSRIKDNSPIKDQIRVGDLILEVDGEDVSKLRVIHVASKFMIAYCSMGCV